MQYAMKTYYRSSIYVSVYNKYIELYVYNVSNGMHITLILIQIINACVLVFPRMLFHTLMFSDMVLYLMFAV